MSWPPLALWGQQASSFLPFEQPAQVTHEHGTCCPNAGLRCCVGNRQPIARGHKGNASLLIAKCPAFPYLSTTGMDAFQQLEKRLAEQEREREKLCEGSTLFEQPGALPPH